MSGHRIIAASIALLAIAILVLAFAVAGLRPTPTADPNATCALGGRGLPIVVVPGTCPPGAVTP